MSDRSQESIDREKFYDEDIAPVLRDLRDKCGERGLNFLSVTEWDATEESDGDWAIRGRLFGRRSGLSLGPNELQISDFFVGLNELAKRGYLCKNITTLTVVQESGSLEQP
jgi:hypothetical protein